MDETLIQEVFRSGDDHRTFKTGDAIFRQGEAGHLMYILVEGIVEVMIGDVSIGAFEPIEVFGEMAIIDQGPRSATIIAKSDCKLVAVNQGRFLFLIQQNPKLAIHIMKMLVERIRWMNESSNTAEETSDEQTPTEAPAAELPASQSPEPETPPPAPPQSSV